jgi:hypothetical protein
VEGDWRNMCDLLSLDAIGYRRRDMHDGYYFDPNEVMQRQLQRFRALVTQFQDGDDASVEADVEPF